MKLYLSSYRIPTPDALKQLLGKPLSQTTVAFIGNAKDYYAKRARDYKINDCVSELTALGLKVEVIDLREYDDEAELRDELKGHDMIWAMGGNTYCLRYEAKRSGFESIIRDLLEGGMVYGGDSAGALLAGTSIAGIESADNPAFAEEVMESGLSLVPYVVLPHVDNPEFTEAAGEVHRLHPGQDIIELTDAQAVIFDGTDFHVTERTSDPETGTRAD
ncbi:MAG TPA: Type 1 glutamine amidotransferase-like domain-containing protein [Bacillota bacterium]|nr:Type 1 glutamine amidotransferase-like domain-containing protein [Bacillota bacterium]